MQRIALDMDGVIADVYQQLFDLDEKDFGRRRTIEEVTGKPEKEIFPNIRTYLFEPGFFRTLPVIAGSQEIVRELYHRYDLYIVSAAMEFPLSPAEKQDWLQEHFPFIPWQKIVFCGSKQIVQADIMIDDHFKNLDHFTGNTGILFTQPHNALSDAGRNKRVHNWDEIARLLL